MKKYSLFVFLLLCMIHYKCFARGLTLESSAFQMNSTIPTQYTCKGADQSPPLAWHSIPIQTKSLVLIVDDPDAPDGVWTHWILFNIPPTIHQLDTASPIPPGATTAKNSWGELGYRGPCPPVGAHSYHFKLYALNTVINLGDDASRDALLNAITGHVIESTELVGIYQSFE
ncbi:phosphatidylethanolamine-binding protein [Legionella santicrucis]|uniref:Phosphatidylethanolamine-binding protein n=1 Tax=Legionella santicrucis TaxID=45074 RepID=A0A0W0ZBR3_9GAMM|nr:YbhB/YbcL family Raf kinase inhibitor-like protein [Legionella santicrucis]KTD66629.1 phosphatidylethanolamine-binding protein [Legionella santicrucis]